MALEYPFTNPTELVAALAPHTMTARFVLGSVILLYAIWSDLLHRRVRNQVWLVTLGIGVVLAVVDVVYGHPPVPFLVMVPVVMAVAYVLWRLRLLFGGADAKCVMAFALLVPYPAAVVGGGAAYPHLPSVLPVPASVVMLTNAVVFTLAVPLAFFVVNLARRDLHPLAMWLGTRMPLARVFTEPVWVMEWVRVPGEEKGTSLDETSEDPELDDEGLPPVDRAELEGAEIKLVYMPTRAGDYALNLARLRALGVDVVWATPKVPFMVPLFLGFVSAFLAGDVITAVAVWFAQVL